MKTIDRLRLAVLCGGPSPERGISLNSARSVSDHLAGEGVEIVPIYFDLHARPYQLTPDRLYSNTPSDFDFKLHSFAHPMSEDQFQALLKTVDIVFPALHGKFGEDGEIQQILAASGTPFIGADADACKACFDKFNANETIREHGFFALPSVAISGDGDTLERTINQFFATHNLSRAIVKPATGGSSIGVFSVASAEEAIKKARDLLADGFYDRVVVEELCTGIEFTAVILDNHLFDPVCLLPVEIEADYENYQIFDFRKNIFPQEV